MNTQKYLATLRKEIRRATGKERQLLERCLRAAIATEKGKGKPLAGY